MKIQHVFAVCFSLCIFQLSAQDNSETKLPLLKLTDVAILPGGQFHSPISGSKANFQTLAPESQLLQEEMTGYENSTYNFHAGLAQVNLLAGFRIADRGAGVYKNNTQLRLGVSYNFGNMLSNFYHRDERTPFDTLVSTQTGEEFYVDSVRGHLYSMNYYQQRIGLQASMLWNTDPAKRWSLYGGVGASVDFTFNAYTRISYHEYDRLDAEHGLAELYDQNHSRRQDIYEEYENKGSVGASIFAPFGVDFRLGNQNEFWKHLHLFIEARPGISFINVPELGQYVRPFGYMGWGIRYSI